MRTPRDLLSAAAGASPIRPLFVHAHPDDEAVQTGGLVAWLASNQIPVSVVTCTRGEKGETIPGTLSPSATAVDLVEAREQEWLSATRILGTSACYLLGTAPARAHGAEAASPAGDSLPPGARPELSRRDYRDSGMRWVREGLAGPADDDDPQTFTAAPISEERADLLALIDYVKPTLLVGYDRLGSYGHPDHVRAHDLSVAAAEARGLPLFEVASEPDAAGFEYFDLSEQKPTVIKALACYATQLRVIDDEIVHVGNQHQALPLYAGLRRTR